MITVNQHGKSNIQKSPKVPQYVTQTAEQETEISKITKEIYPIKRTEIFHSDGQFRKEIYHPQNNGPRTPRLPNLCKNFK